jgi:hypothetical protein
MVSQEQKLTTVNSFKNAVNVTGKDLGQESHRRSARCLELFDWIYDYFEPEFTTSTTTTATTTSTLSTTTTKEKAVTQPPAGSGP